MENFIFKSSDELIKIVDDIVCQKQLYKKRMDDEIDEQINRLKQKFKSRICSLENAEGVYTSILEKNAAIIHKNSKFKLNEIGNIISYLMTNVEGKKYSYINIKTENNKYMYMISRNLDDTNFDYQDSVILKTSNELASFDEEIFFYDLHYMKNIDVKDYNYIYDFINDIIGYRTTNNRDINRKDLSYLIMECVNNSKNAKRIVKSFK